MDPLNASDIIQQFLHTCNRFMWDGAMIFLLLGTHLFFTVRLKFIQRGVFKGIRLSLSGQSPFASLSTILAATIGIGNIIGISTAIALGGPGAVFWCVMTGIFGMATSYAECYLSLHYRDRHADGSHSGGPMYVLERGLHCLPLGLLFALFTVVTALGVGASLQAQSAAQSIQEVFSIPAAATGFFLAIPAGFVLIGGAKSITRVCMRLVPAMGIFFLTACFYLLFLNRDYLLPAASLILRSAFQPRAAAGGLAASSMLLAARYGVARGLFTNEAGLGSAPIAAAGADTDNPGKQALVSMTAVFWDTIVLCTVTGLAIVTHVLRYPETISSLAPTELTAAAFGSIPLLGRPMLAIATLAFAFATIIGWYYFGEQAFLFLVSRIWKNKKDPKALGLFKAFQILYIVMVFSGAVLSVGLVWEFTDFMNACMAVPNILCLILLYKKIPQDMP